MPVLLLCMAFFAEAQPLTSLTSSDPEFVPPIAGIAEMRVIARLTGTEGSDSINPTWKVGIGGTDLGHMIYHRGRTFFIFGDTFSSELSYQGEPETGHSWRWNSMAWTTDNDPSDGITFDGWITDEQGMSRAIIRDERLNPITNIPTGGISLGDRIYLWYMSMKFWGDKNDHCWRSHFAGLAWSGDDGRTFHIQEDFQFPEGSAFGMVAAARGNDDPSLKDGFVYLWGTPSNRCGGISLARFAPDEITSRTAYRYYSGLGSGGEPVWAAQESDAAEIVPSPVGEMSVMYNRWAGCWIMLYITFHEGENPMNTPGHIVLRQAPAPWGPWSGKITLATDRECPGGLYGSYMNPRYVGNNGQTVYFTLSLWNPYDVYWLKVSFVPGEVRNSQ